MQAFENTSTNVAAAQMRNALTNLAETVEDPDQKKVRFRLVLHGISDHALTCLRPSCLKLRWTTSSLCSDVISTTRPRETPCMFCPLVHLP
jgi:hypothetical protein